jgi:FAD/FMN-containing dehydrogenase
MDLRQFAEEVGSFGGVTVSGLGSRGGPVPEVRCVHAPAGIEWVQTDEMTVACGAGTPVAHLAAVLAEHGQCVALASTGTVGGALAMGIRRLGHGPVRNTLLQTHFVSAGGAVVKAGGPTVKNVSGFDLCRLLVGSRGTLGFLGSVILRTRPLPAAARWFSATANEPFTIFRSLYRPVSVLWDGSTLWALLEGDAEDIAAQASAAALTPCDGPPDLPAGRSSVPPAAIGALTGTFVAEVGVGIVHGVQAPRTAPTAAVALLGSRIKHEFDPTGRLNPGVTVG